MFEPKVIHAEEMCCGYKRCPSVKLYEDGSVELTDNDVEGGSVGTIKLHPEVAKQLAQLIQVGPASK